MKNSTTPTTTRKGSSTTVQQDAVDRLEAIVGEEMASHVLMRLAGACAAIFAARENYVHGTSDNPQESLKRAVLAATGIDREGEERMLEGTTALMLALIGASCRYIETGDL